MSALSGNNFEMNNSENGQEVEEVDEKPRTLFVGNIPPSVKKRDLELLFGDIGPIKRCYIQYPKKGPGPDKGEPLVAYITYALTEDATAAIEKFSGHKLEKNKLNIKLVKSRAEQRTPRGPVSGANAVSVVVDEEQKKKNREAQKMKKKINSLKKSRLIVRNISFQATEEKLKEHFGGCGTLTDVNILRKKDGKLVGCAFIQYDNVHGAFKALKELNGHNFMGRPVVLDWAVPKDKYENASKEPEEVAVKSEPEDSDEDVKVKKEKKSKDGDESADDDDDEEDEDDVQDLEDDDDEDDDEDEEEEKPQKRPQSVDADEGKTLFIRNLSFDTTNEELKEFFQKFGDLHYALICMDSLTEHSKGTGFVKFKNLEDAEKCLEKFDEEQEEFQLNDRQFYVQKALSKGRLEEKMNFGKTEEHKDNRHLYLSREGFIRPGSEAALGVSAVDMDKRAALHQRKKQMLKDLSIFISTTRLCVHNLPPTCTDKQLKQIFYKHAGPGAEITEARVMKDLKTINRVSKEFGFVTFTTHPHALTALRAINNNPTIFTPNRRPIVEFSLENRKALKAKEQRLQKSKEKLPVKSEPSEGDNETEKKLSRKEKRKLKREESKAAKSKAQSEDTNVDEVENEGEENEEEEPAQKKKKLRHRDQDQAPEFAGLAGKKGVTNLPAMKAKGKITRKSLKKKKPKRLERRAREPKTAPKARPEIIDSVDKMISKHKKQTTRLEKKWFE